MQPLGKCFCPYCKQVLVGHIEVDDHVWLARRCPEHGQVRTILYWSPSYFQLAVDQRQAVPQKCLIVEVTERCDVGCATCSARSISIGKERSATAVVEGALADAGALGASVVALSGGEPLMRADLWTIVDALSAEFAKIVLITSGRNFENNAAILADLAARKDRLEVCLQFDSLDNEVLKAIRTPAMDAELRKTRLRLSVATGVPITAVCVVPPLASEQSVAELARFCRDEGAAGVTFQPLRQLGRFPSVTAVDSKMTAGDHIQALALQGLGIESDPVPFVQQPFDISVAMTDGVRLVNSDTFFQPAAAQPLFRVATSSYWDHNNYFAPLASAQPYYFSVGGGMPLNAWYFAEAREEPSPQHERVSA